MAAHVTPAISVSWLDLMALRGQKNGAMASSRSNVCEVDIECIQTYRLTCFFTSKSTHTQWASVLVVSVTLIFDLQGQKLKVKRRRKTQFER